MLCVPQRLATNNTPTRASSQFIQRNENQPQTALTTNKAEPPPLGGARRAEQPVEAWKSALGSELLAIPASVLVLDATVKLWPPQVRQHIDSMYSISFFTSILPSLSFFQLFSVRNKSYLPVHPCRFFHLYLKHFLCKPTFQCLKLIKYSFLLRKVLASDQLVSF